MKASTRAWVLFITMWVLVLGGGLLGLLFNSLLVLIPMDGIGIACGLAALYFLERDDK